MPLKNRRKTKMAVFNSTKIQNISIIDLPLAIGRVFYHYIIMMSTLSTLLYFFFLSKYLNY